MKIIELKKITCPSCLQKFVPVANRLPAHSGCNLPATLADAYAYANPDADIRPHPSDIDVSDLIPYMENP